jgi:hypothetical protein
LGFDEGNEAYVLGFDLLEEPVHLTGTLDILVMDNAQDVNRDVVLPHEAVSLHHLLMGGLLILGDAILVMHFLWAIQAESHSKTLRSKKLAPVFIKESSVCLNTVGDTPMRRLMLALKFHNLAKVGQSK